MSPFNSLFTFECIRTRLTLYAYSTFKGDGVLPHNLIISSNSDIINLCSGTKLKKQVERPAFYVTFWICSESSSFTLSLQRWQMP